MKKEIINSVEFYHEQITSLIDNHYGTLVMITKIYESYLDVQWSLSKPDTIGEFISVLYKKVSFIQGSIKY